MHRLAVSCRAVALFGSTAAGTAVTSVNTAGNGSLFRPTRCLAEAFSSKWQNHRLRYYTEEQESHYDYDQVLYKHPRELRYWYARHETRFAKKMLESLAVHQSLSEHHGLSREGEGPMERELIRKGIQVEKYPLPTLTGVRRLHELVLLRRQKLERMSETKMKEQREAKKQAFPSWLDESKGPVNGHFLKLVQGGTYAEDVTAALGATPYIPSRTPPATPRSTTSGRA